MALLYFFLFLIFFIIISPFITGIIFIYLAKIGIDFLEISYFSALGILIMVVIGSFIDIPFGKKVFIEVTESRFFGIMKRKMLRRQGISLNVGGALIPFAISAYYLTQVPLEPLLITTGVVTFFSFLGAHFVEKKGVLISITLPILFSVLFSTILEPAFAQEIAFSAGVFGVFIGADLLHLKTALKKGSGAVSIGGAGVFDGIFLVGVLSALLAGIALS